MTLMEKVHCMHSNVGLPKSFWVEVASIACFLVNQSPSSVIDKKIPEEVWSGTPADYSDLKNLDVLPMLTLIMENWNLDL